MGSEVIAKCRCGLNEKVLVGGGKLSFATTCYFPCLCARCRAVVQANLLATPTKCPRCRRDVVAYDDSSLSRRAGKHMVAGWNLGGKQSRPLILTDGDYCCPRCGEMTLRFMDSGRCWD